MQEANTFTTVANGNPILVEPGEAARIIASIATAETFEGLVRLESSRDGGQSDSWAAVGSAYEWDGQSVALDDSLAVDVTVENTTRDRLYYRLACTVATTNDGVTFTLSTAGNFGSRATRATHLAMVAWLATLPTADPHIVGEPYVASGAVKVSAG